MANVYWIATTAGSWATAANWSGGAVPVNGDNVRLPAGTASINAGLDQSAVTLANFIIDEGYAGAIGTPLDSGTLAYLQIGCTRFEFAGTGESLINLGSSNIPVQIFDTAIPETGEFGLLLKGSNLTVADIEGGYVGFATIHGETATIATLRVKGAAARVWAGSGCTLTTVENYAGELELRAACTTLSHFKGRTRTSEVGAITTLNVWGGTMLPESTGTITTANLYGGTTNFTGSGEARTVTTLKQNVGSTLLYDPNVLTITTRAAPEFTVPIKLVATPA
jgi:hypothetical protein